MPALTTLTGPAAPLLIDTCALRKPKRCAIKAISSAFALPSTGGDLIRASHVPSSCSSSAATREFGLTRTWIFTSQRRVVSAFAFYLSSRRRVSITAT